MSQPALHNPLTDAVTPLFSRKKFRNEAPAPFLPMSRAEMDRLGWDQCDVIVVTGDAYIDHPSFGMAIIGRLLEAQGFRVGIIAQPDWNGVADFQKLGAPRLFWGVTAGNMDSMVNHYTSDRRLRHDDAYTPDGVHGKRPDRASLIYTARCHQAAPGVPVILGGIEASLRRLAHYDYWSDKIRHSILFDAKADLIIYGNAERALSDVAFRIAENGIDQDFSDIRGLALIKKSVPEDYRVLHADDLDTPEETRGPIGKTVIRIPSYEEVVADKEAYARASRVFHRESNPGNAHAIVQRHGDRELWMTPPPIPLTTPEMDAVYEMPFARAPHPSYGKAKIPAWDMIKNSVTILRGCFGGCAFCSITEHEGRIIQSRSEKSVLKEICKVRDKTEGFAGIISDIGGPTANMYRMACKSPEAQAVCKRPSCVYPDICKNMNTSHDALIALYRKARNLPGIRKVMIASGVRYDLAVRSPEYIRELVTYHLSGYLKIAPEHTEPGPLAHMMKPGIATYDHFKEIFDQATKAAGKKYFLIPYFIAAHPGTTDQDMLNLALWLKKNNFRPDQVQTYLASPMALSTAMYYSGYNPLKPVRHGASEPVDTVKGGRQRRLHKAFLRYHDPENWPLLRAALREMGRADLIGPRADQLVPLNDGPGHVPHAKDRKWEKPRSGGKPFHDRLADKKPGGRDERRPQAEPKAGKGRKPWQKQKTDRFSPEQSQTAQAAEKRNKARDGYDSGHDPRGGGKRKFRAKSSRNRKA